MVFRHCCYPSTGHWSKGSRALDCQVHANPQTVAYSLLFVLCLIHFVSPLSIYVRTYALFIMIFSFSTLDDKQIKSKLITWFDRKYLVLISQPAFQCNLKKHIFCWILHKISCFFFLFSAFLCKKFWKGIFWPACAQHPNAGQNIQQSTFLLWLTP